MTTIRTLKKYGGLRKRRLKKYAGIRKGARNHAESRPKPARKWKNPKGCVQNTRKYACLKWNTARPRIPGPGFYPYPLFYFLSLLLIFIFHKHAFSFYMLHHIWGCPARGGRKDAISGAPSGQSYFRPPPRFLRVSRPWARNPGTKN